MNAGGRGWSEPTPDELAKAIDSYDHVIAGGKPRDPIENGLRLARKVARANGMVEDPEARPRTIAALARIVQVDRDEPKARVNSLMAARMIMTDLSLQRDAAIGHDLDVLDARDWWSGQDVTARRPAWTGIPLLSRQMTMLRDDPASIEALARADFHLLAPEDSAVLRNSMEGLRSSVNMYRIDMEIDLQSAAGLLPEEKADRMRGLLAAQEGRSEVKSQLWALARRAISKDRVGFPEPYGTDRERSSQSSAINFRQRMNDSRSSPEPAPVTDEHRTKARRALLDADFSSPETPEGRAVKASVVVLRDLGVPDRLFEGEAFRRTVAHAISRTHDFTTGEVQPNIAATDIVASTIVRNLAVEIVADSDSMYRGASEETLDRNRVDAAFRMVHDNTSVMLTQSARDLPDIRLLAEGRADEVGDSTGIRSNLIHALSEAAFKGSIAQRVSKGLSDIREAGLIETAPVRSSLSGIVKGPRESGADWIAMMSAKAKGREAF